MRLWTLHPRYLDPQGLVALWREALLAQKVLRGRTVGYKSHPQLIRFREQSNSIASIARYLSAIHDESLRRGYRFDKSKIGRNRSAPTMEETAGQLSYEWTHLKRKLKKRSPDHFNRIAHIAKPGPHPLFKVVPGKLRDWERVRA